MSSTNRGSKRIAGDAYQTPIWCVDLIIKELRLPGRILNFYEPCIGEGNIFNKFADVTNAEGAEINIGLDYFQQEPRNIDLIVTNPPFSQAIRFLQKSLSEVPCVIYLMRVGILETQTRHDFWQKEEHRPTHMFVHSKRPSFIGNGTDSTAYAWFVWEKRSPWKRSLLKRKPGIYVI